MIVRSYLEEITKRANEPRRFYQNISSVVTIL